jgi:restriction endonuclease S subunit
MALNNILIPLPSLTSQDVIVAKLDAEKARCEKLKAAALRGLAAAEDLRKAILAEAFEQP